MNPSLLFYLLIVIRDTFAMESLGVVVCLDELSLGTSCRRRRSGVILLHRLTRPTTCRPPGNYLAAMVHENKEEVPGNYARLERATVSMKDG